MDPGTHACPGAKALMTRRRAIELGLGGASVAALTVAGLRTVKLPVPGLPAPPYRRDRFIFEPSERYPSSHASTVVQTGNGDLLAAWYTGTGEKAPDVAIYSSRLARGGDSWAEPQIIADTPDQSEGNPVLWVDPGGSVWLFYVTMYGSSWNDCKIKYKISEDHGRTWGEEVVLRDELGWMTRNSPLVLGDEEVLLPVYNEVNWHSMVIITKDWFRTWKAYGDLDSPGGAIQPTVVRREDGSLLMYMRTDADRIWMSESRNEGRSWSAAVPTDLNNPNAAVCLLKLESGRLALAFNDSTSDRNPLNIALSKNDGRTWPWWRIVEGGEGKPGSFAYPFLAQSDDGRIHVTYTYNRDTIKHVVTNETWVRRGF